MKEAIVDESTLAPESCQGAVSIQAIIRGHHDTLVSFLRRRLGVAEDAHDVAQETYIRMMKYEGSRNIGSPLAMLFRIAVNVANDHGRAARARCASNHTQIDDVPLESDYPSAERFTAASQEFDQLLNVIESLPEKCRHVFLLSRVKGMTYPEIARHCGISVKMVEKHISKALAACTREVGEQQADSS
jgi:RNA polymerase sigma-70 factor (ECF subfamily)